MWREKGPCCCWLSPLLFMLPQLEVEGTWSWLYAGRGPARPVELLAYSPPSEPVRSAGARLSWDRWLRGPVRPAKKVLC